jgi:hypothetical protein
MGVRKNKKIYESLALYKLPTYQIDMTLSMKRNEFHKRKRSLIEMKLVHTIWNIYRSLLSLHLTIIFRPQFETRRNKVPYETFLFPLVQRIEHYKILLEYNEIHETIQIFAKTSMMLDLMKTPVFSCVASKGHDKSFPSF